MTKMGYIKRMSNDTFKAQNRGGKGIKGMQTIDEDYVEELFMTHTHHYIMFFTNKGRAYRLKAYEKKSVQLFQLMNIVMVSILLWLLQKVW